MTREERKMAHYLVGAAQMSAHEKRVAAHLMSHKADFDAAETVLELVAARGQTVRKRSSDQRTDRDRRVLVGARVSRAAAGRYKAAAEAIGVSLYRFTVEALEQMCERV